MARVIWRGVVDRHPRLRVAFLDAFFPGAPQMLSERLGRLSPEAKHQVLAGGALGFYRT